MAISAFLGFVITLICLTAEWAWMDKASLTFVITLIYVAAALTRKDENALTFITSNLCGTCLILSSDDAGNSAQLAGQNSIVVGNATRGNTSGAFRSIQVIARWLERAVCC